MVFKETGMMKEDGIPVDLRDLLGDPDWEILNTSRDVSELDFYKEE